MFIFEVIFLKDLHKSKLKLLAAVFERTLDLLNLALFTFGEIFLGSRKNGILPKSFDILPPWEARSLGLVSIL